MMFLLFNLFIALIVGCAPIPVFFGDSITAGLGASDAAHRWVNLVAEDQGWVNFVNSGISGTHLQNSPNQTGVPFANNGRDTYVTRVLDHSPQYVFILYGMNDFRYRDPDFTADAYQADLEYIVDALITDGIEADNIILGTIPYVPAYTYTDRGPDYDAGTLEIHMAYNAAILDVALSRGTRYADVYNAMAANGGDALSSDGVHPNDGGHQVIANAFVSALD